MRPLALLVLCLAAACAPKVEDDGNPVKGGDELSPLVGTNIVQAEAGLRRAGYREAGTEGDAILYSNWRTGACARIRSEQGILITVVQLPEEVCA